MTYFGLRVYNILPKKELHLSLQIALSDFPVKILQSTAMQATPRAAILSRAESVAHGGLRSLIEHHRFLAAELRDPKKVLEAQLPTYWNTVLGSLHTSNIAYNPGSYNVGTWAVKESLRSRWEP